MTVSRTTLRADSFYLVEQYGFLTSAVPLLCPQHNLFPTDASEWAAAVEARGSCAMTGDITVMADGFHLD